MKEYKIIYNVNEWDLNQLSEDGWTIINIFPSEYEQYEINRYKTTELTAVIYRERTKTEILENTGKSCLRSDIETKLLNILSERFEMEASDINIHSDLVEDLCLDSLDIVDLAILLEKEFNVKIPDEDMDALFVTVEDIINYILKNQGK